MRKVLMILLSLVGLFLLKPVAVDAKAIEIGFKDEKKITYEGDWGSWHDSRYLSRYTGKGKRTGKAICKPDLKPGKYEVFVKFRASTNRGTHARYLVNDKFVKEINQNRQSWSEDYPNVSLGVFEMTADSTVTLEGRDGQSYAVSGFSFLPTTKEAGASTGTGTDTGSGATEPVDGKNVEKEMAIEKDGELVIQPYLTTFKPAEFKVFVDEQEVFAWSRSNDSDNEPCVINGQPDPKSMQESKPGDFTATRGLEYKVPVKAGQKVRTLKKGDFLPTSYLKIKAPTAGATAGLADLLKGAQ